MIYAVAFEAPVCRCGMRRMKGLDCRRKLAVEMDRSAPVLNYVNWLVADHFD